MTEVILMKLCYLVVIKCCFLCFTKHFFAFNVMMLHYLA